ncbi:hypothetical protein PENTCL1PPCAC_25167, partial [Pristionchus entomophagus]
RMSSSNDSRLAHIVDGPILDAKYYYYDVHDPEFLDWFDAARQWQSKYIHDNGETDFFVYKPDERNDLTKMIRMKIFGIRPEHIGYTIKETQEAIKIKKKIIEVSGGTESIAYINGSYLSTFTYLDGKFHATEVPVFVVQSSDQTRRFVDTRCEVFKCASDVVQSIGSLFEGGIMYTENLLHKAIGDTGKVTLHYTESKGSSLQERTLKVIETTLAFATIVLGVTSVAISMPLAGYVRAASGVKFYIDVFTSPEVTVANKEWNENNEKREWIPEDYHRLSESIFSLYNIVISPWMLADILSSELLKFFKFMEESSQRANSQCEGNEDQECRDKVIVLRPLVLISEKKRYLLKTYQVMNSAFAESGTRPQSHQRISEELFGKHILITFSEINKYQAGRYSQLRIPREMYYHAVDFGRT